MIIGEVINGSDRDLPVVSHTVDFHRRYPGETLTFFSRVTANADLGNFRMRITLPDGIDYSDCRSLSQPQGTVPLFSHADGITHLIWDVERESEQTPKVPGAATVYDYWVKAVVLPTAVDCSLESKAVLTSERADGQSIYTEEITSITVTTRGLYLKYLPSIYQEDELMGRFLMLFESFLAPIEMQIEQNAYFYDPRLAPAEFLPWLAAWTGIILDSQLPEKTRRKLLHASASLFRKRGTRQGLHDYLEIYTGGKVQIIEHFSENFCLGPTAFLGPGIAFGSENVPNTFMVNLSIPPNPPSTGGFPPNTGSLPVAMSTEDLHKDKLLIERKVASIIDAEKPAHTGYELYVEIDPNLEWQN